MFSRGAVSSIRTAVRVRTAVPVARSAAHRQHRRTMAGDAGPPPDPATLEGKIHAQFPEAHQKVLAMCGVYFGCYLLAKVVGGGSKEEDKPVASAAPAVVSADDDVPSVYSENFDAWIAKAGNAEKYAESLKKWEEALEQEGGDKVMAAWEKTALA